MIHTIYTYGGGEVLETMFNAIAALVSSKGGSLYNTLIRIGLMVGICYGGLYPLSMAS